MFTIKSMSCDCRHGGDFHIVREQGWEGFIILFAKTKAHFVTPDGIITTEPNTVIIYNNGSRQEYGAADEFYEDDYIRFDCSDNEIHRFISIMDKPIFIDSSIRIDDYMHIICDAYYGGRGERICSHLINVMLEDIAAVSSRSEKQSAHFRALVELRKDIYSFPEKERTIKSMADEMTLSEPYFQEVYKKAFGISPVADVISSRIEAAKSLLTDKNLSVSEVAALCGYSSAVHFSRQFRKSAGVSPAEYRKK